MDLRFLRRNSFALISAGIVAALLSSGGSAAPADMTEAPLAALNKAATVQVKETLWWTDRNGALYAAMVYNVSLLRPRKIHIEETKIGETKVSSVVTSAGATSVKYDTAKNQYTKMKATLKDLPGLAVYPAGTSSTTVMFHGKPVLLYKVKQDISGYSVTAELWVDPKTHLPEQQSLLAPSDNEWERIEFSDWSLGKPLAPTLFAFTPPVGATEFVPPPALPAPPAPELLANGTVAPDFTAIDKDGKSVKLSDYKGKVVVIDFWASWCPPCRASMPHNQEVAKKFQEAGTPFVLLAVDNSEERDAFSKWVAANGPDLSALTFVHIPPATSVAGKLYLVSGIPTQYVINAKGKITDSFVGYGGPTDELANAIKAAGASL